MLRVGITSKVVGGHESPPNSELLKKVQSHCLLPRPGDVEEAFGPEHRSAVLQAANIPEEAVLSRAESLVGHLGSCICLRVGFSWQDSNWNKGVGHT